MHQPSYIRGDVITMPWVFLHSIKDYFDMPYIVESTGVKATFNVTSTLIEQIKVYEKNPLKDKFLSLWIKHPSELNNEDKTYLLKVIKSINENLIINDYFKELLSFDILDDNEFINLEVLFMLSWCGDYLRNNLDSFISKKSYTQSDKEYLFNTLKDFIKTILPYYEKLVKKGVISLFTTPYSHPILPLLLNIENAVYANQSTKLPPNSVRLKEDALQHIKKSKEIYKNTFYVEANGFWPAEGAVDEESLDLYFENGIKYIATDEAILHRSGEMNHHIPYTKKGVIVFFRDHSLSDLIGFKYRFFNENDAVNDFVSKLPNDGIVSIIVDGENAWEFYKNRGFSFLKKLYLRLKNESNMIKATDIDYKDCKELNHLVSGSWIYGNFNTWIGDEEKNKAWEYLFKAKKVYEAKEKNSEVDEKFLLCECSDWFWWYGEGHYTEFAKEFDELFRNHLIDIYILMNEEVPSELFIPIIKEDRKDFIIKPKNEITPFINGSFSSIFEWYGAGMIDETKLYSTMDRKKIIEKLYFGMDKDNIYFALSGDIHKIENFKIFIDDEYYQLNKSFENEMFLVKTSKMIEIKISKNITKNDKFLVKFDLGLELVPSFGAIEIDKFQDYSNNWFI
jgi:alpha-amylase/alpha-mannosidase (GH57 family)